LDKKKISLIAAFLALALIVWVMPTVQGLTVEGKRVLGIAVFAIIVWATSAVSDALSGFLIVFFLAFFTGKTSIAFSGYSNTALWLLVVGFIMAAGMEKCGLSRRIALYLISLAGGSARKIYWAIGLVMAILTFLVPSITARTLLMLPIILGIGEAFGARPGKSPIVKALLFIVAISGTLMSIGVLTAHAGNPITAGLIQTATKQTVTWSQWLVVGGPPAFISGFLSILLLQILWPPETSLLGEGEAYVKKELEKMGQFSKVERYTLIVFIVTLILWATDTYHKINATVIGLVAVILLIWPQFGVMDWKEASGKVPWNVFVLYGAGLSMGSALVSSGVAKWIAGTALAPISHLAITTQLIVLIWFATALQVFFTGGGPKTTALTPIVLAHAVTIGADPLVFGLIMGMNMQHQYLLPVSNMPNAVIMGTGHLEISEVIKTGAIASIFAAAFFSLMVFTYWRWIGVMF
jgi:anion transporter